MRALALVVLAACSTPAAPPAALPLSGSAVAITAACRPIVFGAHVVDAGSAVMEKIRTYVAVEGGQSRTQGGAIRIESEEWTEEGPGAPPAEPGLFGPSVTVDWFATAADRAALARFFAAAAAADPALAVPADRKVLFERTADGRWRSYLVHAEPALTNAHVAKAVSGPHEIGLQLTAEGNRALIQVTRENIGRKLALVLDGTVSTAFIIAHRIYDAGGIAVAVPRTLTPAEIEAQVARFSCSS